MVEFIVKIYLHVLRYEIMELDLNNLTNTYLQSFLIYLK